MRVKFYVCPHCGNEIDPMDRRRTIEWDGKIKIKLDEEIEAAPSCYAAVFIRKAWADKSCVLSKHDRRVSGEYELRLIHRTCSGTLVSKTGKVEDFVKSLPSDINLSAPELANLILNRIVNSTYRNPATLLKSFEVVWSVLDDRPVKIPERLSNVPKWKLRRIASRANAKELARMV